MAMGQEQTPSPSTTSISKHFNTYLKVDYIFHLLCFVIGLSFGLLLFFNINTVFISLQASFFSYTKTSHLLPNKAISTASSSLLIPSSSSSGTQTHNYTNNIVSLTKSKSLVHNMSDQELLSTASTAHENQELPSKIGVPKVAFMFLTKGPLPLAPLWNKFFKGHEGYYSIYVHADPFYSEFYPEDSVFSGRRIPSQQVFWGTSTMIDAERRLLGNALLDFSNKRFVLLSESCIPLFNFESIYNHLMKSNKSFVGSFDEPTRVGRGRYNPWMQPIVNITDWRKGSQWFEVHRDLAIKIVSDKKYYQVFIDYCHPPCYMDEHYIPTLVTMLYGELNSNRTLTWVDWSQGGAHPRSFRWPDITDKLLNQIRHASQCVYNVNTTSMCALFARKFMADSLEPLLRVEPLLLGFNP